MAAKLRLLQGSWLLVDVGTQYQHNPPTIRSMNFKSPKAHKVLKAAHLTLAEGFPTRLCSSISCLEELLLSSGTYH